MKTVKPIKIISAAIVVSVLCIMNIDAQSQSAGSIKLAVNTDSYKNSFGLRVGETSGLTFKHFINQTHAFEGILGMWPNALGITGLYEKHAQAFNTEGMTWYYGGGGHATFASRRVYYWYNNGDKYFYSYRSEGSMGLGIDGILGLEYKIKEIPFALSLDMKPFIELNTNGGFLYSLDPGLGIKLAF